MLVKQQIAARDQARRNQNSIEEEKEPPTRAKPVPLPTKVKGKKSDAVHTARSERAPDTPVLNEQMKYKAQLANMRQQETAMTHQANLMYDLLHIEIEKIRRKAIGQIQHKFE